MSISFDLPRELETGLRREVTDLDRAAKEALLVELYRTRRISHQELASALDLSRYETDGLLKRHEVYHDVTLEDVLRDSENSRQARLG